MSIKALLQEWPRYFDTPPKNRSNKKYLVSELIYRLQELTYGGLTKKTIDRLEALAESKIVNERKCDSARLAIGTRLVREIMRHEGWRVIPEQYDDDGYSGGNMDRPGLQKLMADIEAGRVAMLCASGKKPESGMKRWIVTFCTMKLI